MSFSNYLKRLEKPNRFDILNKQNTELTKRVRGHNLYSKIGASQSQKRFIPSNKLPSHDYSNSSNKGIIYNLRSTRFDSNFNSAFKTKLKTSYVSFKQKKNNDFIFASYTPKPRYKA